MKSDTIYTLLQNNLHEKWSKFKLQKNRLFKIGSLSGHYFAPISINCCILFIHNPNLDSFYNPSDFMLPFLTREFSCKFTCTALSFLCLTEKKESLDSSAGAEQRGNVICCCFYGRWAPARRVHVTPILTKSTVTSHHPQQRNWTYITVPLASTTELWGHYMPLHVMWPLMQIPSATRKLKTSCFW